MAYRVKLPQRSGVHDVFHVSHFRNFLHDTVEVVDTSILKEVEVEHEAAVRRVSTRILGSEVKKLRNREVKLMKVQWGDNPKEATWETEDKIHASFPFLFEGMFLTSFPKLLFMHVSII